MKASEIKIGGIYHAKVSGRIVPVRVDEIHVTPAQVFDNMRGIKSKTAYDVTNQVTGRKTTFRSAKKFMALVMANQKLEAAVLMAYESLPDDWKRRAEKKSGVL